MTSSISSAVRELMTTANQNTQNAGAQASGGGFLEIISQSLQNIAQTQNAQNGQVCDMLGALLEKLKKQPTAEAMAALMELFAQNAPLAENFMAQCGENVQIQMADVLGADTNKLNDLFQGFNEQNTLTKADTQKIVSFFESLPTSQKQVINENINNNEQLKQLFTKLGGEVVKEQGSIQKTESTEDYLTVLQTAKEQKNDVENNFDESEIKSFTVKDMMTADGENVDIKNVKDVEKPQNDKFEIINQFKEGFLENISKKRFTVRLKPEGLGEITVNMLNNEGKISLSILASNQTVQKALEGNLENLQASLRQHNAEITTINETSGKQQSALDLGYGKEQSQNGHNGQNQNRQHKAFFQQNDNLSEEAQEMMDLKEYLMATNSLSMRV